MHASQAKKEAAEGTQALAVATDAATNVVKQEKVEIIAQSHKNHTASILLLSSLLTCVQGKTASTDSGSAHTANTNGRDAQVELLHA